MRRELWLICGVFTLGVSSLAAQLPSPPPAIAAQSVQVDHYPDRDVMFANGVKGLPGLVYRRQEGYRPLTLDLYLPPASVARPAHGFPLVVYIHGGGWLVGDTHRSGPYVDFPAVLASLAARGYVVASVEYRLSGEAIFPAPVQDVKAAIRWLRSRSADYEIDPMRAITWGPSAGGYLAGMVAVTCGVEALEPVQPTDSAMLPGAGHPVRSSTVSDCVQGSVSWFGVFDMATLAAQARQDGAFSRDVPDTPEWRLLGCFASECKKGQIAAASPVTYVDAKSSPMLLIVGAEDKVVPYHQTLEMAERLKAAGVKYELTVLPGVNHVFIGKTPEQTRDATLKALDETFRFIDKTMKNVP